MNHATSNRTRHHLRVQVAQMEKRLNAAHGDYNQAIQSTNHHQIKMAKRDRTTAQRNLNHAKNELRKYMKTNGGE